MGSLDAGMESQHRACGLATIMGIGKAVPEHVLLQKSYPDFYFEITNSNHMVELKTKFANICEKTMVEKRHCYMSHDLLRSNKSLTLRQQLADEGIPRLGAEAARGAISDWGRPATDITHLVVCTTASGCMPGADYEVAKLLGLPPSTKRVVLYQAGCHGAGLALRLTKDLAENNRGARVLVVCSEMMTLWLRGPSEAHIGNLVGQALFGDAAGAVVVGADPDHGSGERALFEMVSASQDVIPGTEEAVVSKLYEEGIVYTLHRDVALHVSSNIEELARTALANAGVLDGGGGWTERLFWVVHPGGREILDRVEGRLGLSKGKLAASREVMRQYGDTLSSCVLLVLDEMRRRSAEQGLRTAGEGREWGLLFGFRPGLTVETILLRALPNQSTA